MSVIPGMNIYGRKFAQSDKTDAILVVLSFHSDYFNTLFNGDFMEKSMQEIPIEDVNFENFAAVLSLIYPKPIKPTKENAEKLLELADRFLLSAAKYHLEYFIISTDFEANKKLELAGTYDLENLLTHALELFKTKEELVPMKQFLGFSANAKVKILDRLIELNMISNNNNVPARDTGDVRRVQKFHKMNRPPPESPIDLRALIHYDYYQWRGAKKSYNTYEKMCEAMEKGAIAFKDYKYWFKQYSKENDRDLPIPDIRGCILSDVINGKAAEKSIDDLCDAFKNHKIDKENHDYWYNRFDSGHLFTRVTFSDFPEDVISEIVDRCDMKSYLNLRNVSHGLRTIVDQLAPPCTDINVRCEYGVCAYGGDALIADSEHLDILELLLRNPKLRLKRFQCISSSRFRTIYPMTDPRYCKKHFFDLLKSLNHKIHAEKCYMRVEYEQDLIGFLKCLKPGTLENMEIDMVPLNGRINKVVSMDQWKMAKHLKITACELPPIENFFHFPSFELQISAITVEDVVKLCENASKSNSFEHCKVQIRKEFKLETLKTVLNLQPTVSPRIYSIPNTNVFIQLIIYCGIETFKIYKN